MTKDDVQRERDAFEALTRKTIAFGEALLRRQPDSYHYYYYADLETAWHAWQAAKLHDRKKERASRFRLSLSEKGLET